MNNDNKPDLAILNQESSDIWVMGGIIVPEVNTDITVISPNGGENWLTGENNAIQWQKGEGILSVDIDLSRDGGTTWETVVQNQSDTIYTWKVTPTGTDSALVRVTDVSVPIRTDICDGLFTIVSSNCCDLAGDFDGSSSVDIADLTAMVAYMFSGGTPPDCQNDADLDFSCSIDIADLTYRVAYMFSGGPPPTCWCME